MSQILVERIDKPLSYIKESVKDGNKHYLGRFEGTFADFANPTRNGRKYPRKLWERVLKDPELQEGIKTHTLFGECDHPETRLETSVKEAAIAISKLYIDESDQTVKGVCDILDTPNGRIIKALADYGSQLGVSSRGSGDIVENAGETIVDPDTYQLVTWDVVTLPAVAKARPAITESANPDRSKVLTESIEKEIKSAKSSEDLNSIKKILESTELPELDSLKKSIDKKLDDTQERETISSKVVEDLEKTTTAFSDLKKENQDLNEQLSAGNTRESKLQKELDESAKASRKLVKRLLGYEFNSKNDQKQISGLTQKLSESQSLVNDLKSKIVESSKSQKDLESQIDNLSSLNENFRRKISELNSKVISVQDAYDLAHKDFEDLKVKYDSLGKLCENKSSEIARKSSEIDDLNSSLAYQKNLTESLKAEISKSKRIVESTKTQLDRSSEIKEKIASRDLRKIESLQKNLEESNNQYLKLKAQQSGVSPSIVLKSLPREYSCKDVDRVVDEIADRNLRYKQLPIAYDFDASSAKKVILQESEKRSPADAQSELFIKNTVMSMKGDKYEHQ